MDYYQDIVIFLFLCLRVFCIIVFIIDQSFQLAFILGCFWLIGTTFDCYGLPHKTIFMKGTKWWKGEKAKHICLYRLSQQNLNQENKMYTSVQTDPFYYLHRGYVFVYSVGIWISGSSMLEGTFYGFKTFTITYFTL